MSNKYSIGLDYGTNSVRTVIVNVKTGDELASNVWQYAHGDEGIILDAKDPNLARQHPQDFVDGIRESVRGALADANKEDGFSPSDVIGIGIDTTGSTPLPVDADGMPLAFKDEYKDNPNAMAWLWKDHTSVAEAEQITALAGKIRPNYLTKIGGTYSSEWFWAKALHCLAVDPDVFEAAHTWVEYADWVPALITGNTAPNRMKRGIWIAQMESPVCCKACFAPIRIGKTVRQ